MPGQFSCETCGGKVTVPAGHARAKIRCTACGYYATVPAAMRSAQADDEPDIASFEDPAPQAPLAEDERPAPAKKVKKSKVVETGPNLLEGTQEEDDDKPYAVPGDGTKKCPACQFLLPLDATFCVRCGGDLTQGKKKKRTFTAIDERWESTASFSLRVKGFLFIQLANALMLANVFYTGASTIAFGTVFMNILMQAFLLGTYDTLFVKRTTKGSATLSKIWRVCFIPQPAQKIDWKKNHGVGVFGLHDPWLMEYGMLLLILSVAAGQISGWFLSGGSMLFFPFVVALSLAPAAAWYWYVIRPERFMIVLCDEYGSTNETIFRTTQREKAEEILTTIASATGLTQRNTV